MGNEGSRESGGGGGEGYPKYDSNDPDKYLRDCGIDVSSLDSDSGSSNASPNDNRRDEGISVCKFREPTHSDNLKTLTDQGIGIRSSGNCSDRNNPKCTSLDGMHAETIKAVVDFQALTGANDIVVTGGTEKGHSTRGEYNHSTGHKVDIALTPGAIAGMKEHCKPTGTRGDGAALCVLPGGEVVAKEKDHYDIKVAPKPAK